MIPRGSFVRRFFVRRGIRASRCELGPCGCVRLFGTVQNCLLHRHSHERLRLLLRRADVARVVRAIFVNWHFRLEWWWLRLFQLHWLRLGLAWDLEKPWPRLLSIALPVGLWVGLLVSRSVSSRHRLSAAGGRALFSALAFCVCA